MTFRYFCNYSILKHIIQIVENQVSRNFTNYLVAAVLAGDTLKTSLR